MKNKTLYFSALNTALAVFLTSCTSVSVNDVGRQIEDSQTYYSNNSRSFLPSLVDLPQEAFRSQQSYFWWERFQDPLLNQFISQALQTSFDTRGALANIEQAEAILKGVRAGLRPSINLDGQIGSIDFESIGAEAGLNASWDLDLFGRTRETVRQAQSDLANSRANLRDVRRLTLARVSQTYIAYRTVEERIHLSKANVKRLEENQNRISRLVEKGYSSRLDLNRTETQVLQLKSNLAALEGQKTSTRNALALFLQTPPAELQAMLSSTVQQKLVLPSNITPPNLGFIVRHRPDVRSAEWNLVSATQSKRAADLALYPVITLGGDIFSLGSIASLGNIGNLSSALFSNIAQPLIGRGRLLANIDQESAIVKQALLNYEETVLRTVLDIDTALRNWSKRQEELNFAKRTLETATEAQEIASKLFFAGETDFTAVIVAETTRLSAEETYLLSRQAAFESYIAYSAATVPNW